jgi:hypothetical protein
MIPLSEARLRAILKIRVAHSNGGSPHSSLGPGVPGPPKTEAMIARYSKFRYRLRQGIAVRSKAVLGRLHHEYAVVPAVAQSTVRTATLEQR